MKLQTRTALVPFFTVSILCAGLYVLVSKLTIESFDHLESKILHKQVETVNNAITNLTDEHANKIVDWAQWDKTYDFIQSLDKSYIDENLNALTMSALGFSSAMYFTPELKLRYGVTVVGEEVKPAAASLIEQTKAILAQNKAQSFQGLVRLENDVVLLAASPILPNKGDQKSRGVLVAVSKITPDTYALVQHLTNLTLKFWQKGFGDIDSRSKDAEIELENGETAVIRPVSKQLSYAYGAVKDVQGKSLLFYQVKDSRQIVSSGFNVRDVSIIILVGVGVLAILLLAIVINLSAAKRIEQFSAQVRTITTSNDSSGRLIDSAPNGRSLRFKTAGGVLLVFVLMTALTSLLLNQYFLHGFEEIEDKVMSDNIERATRALTGRLDKLKGKTIDWAQWDDTYQFIQDHNEAYQTANLGFDTLGPMNMKYLLYFDSANRLVEGREVQSAKATVAPIDKQLVESIAAVPTLSHTAEPVAGFLSLSTGTILTAASPILDTSRTKPALGSMVFAFLADDKLAQELGHQTRLNLHFLPSSTLNLSAPMEISRLSRDEIEGSAVILDVLNKPALGVAIKSDRPIYEQGLLAAKILPIYFILGGIICALATVLWIDRILLSRIRRIGQEARSIKQSGDIQIRVTARGADEISGLANDINSMLAALQITQLELAKAKDAAEIANRDKSMFIARVSHELRNPIHGIRGVNDLILKREGSKAVRDLVKMGDLAAEGLLSIVDEILDFSKAEAGELTFETIAYDVRQVVRETMQVVAARLEGKYKAGDQERVQLGCDINPNVPQELLGDPTRLKQVLINLLTNSVKFTQKGYVGLRIEADRLGSSNVLVKMDIWDTGIGIPEEKLSTLFTPFKQTDESIARKYQGTGLGLSIVKQFTEGLGGTVSVQSVPGNGSTFSVSLPQTIVGSATSYLQREISDKLFPAETIFVAKTSPVFSAMSQTLLKLGIVTSQIDPSDDDAYSDLKTKMTEAALLVVSEETLVLPIVNNTLEERVRSNRGCSIAILRPSSLDLRERLYALGMEYVFSTPVLADDLLLAFLGELPQVGRGREGRDAALKFNRKLSVLIADDMPPNRFILEGMLEDAGHRVTSVCDGREIVELLTPMITGQPNAPQFDVVITDVTMAIMNGDEAARIIRELEKASTGQRHVPIIALTGHAFDEERDRIQAAGIDGVLTKPMTPEMLAAELIRLFSQSLRA